MGDAQVSPPDWSRLMHIGAHQGDIPLRPDLDELGLDEVHRVCNRAWAYSRADFEPRIDQALAESQWRETCALAGSIAESLMLSAASFVEAEWHQRAIEAGTEPSGMALAQRYIADSSVDSTVSVGHRLMNFVARVARTNPETRERFASIGELEALSDTYIPFRTETPKAWLSLEAAALKKLRKAIPAVHEGSIDALRALVASTTWQKLTATRAENFHRWRKEHEYVLGIDESSGHMSDVLDEAGNVVGKRFFGSRRGHRISDGLTARTTYLAGEGVRELARAVEAVITDTLDNLPQLTNGFVLEIDANGHTRRMGGISI
ncbi:hypothetical protein BOH72_22025 [Mycobacterium sp. WY10]|nr:hypothetical protein BOH72_22025 [Mycobacterium sp. WY10]